MRKPNLIETDDDRDFVNKLFTYLLDQYNIKKYSRYTSLGGVFAERFNSTIGDLLKKPVFQSETGNWVDILSTITKQYKIEFILPSS